MYGARRVSWKFRTRLHTAVATIVEKARRLVAEGFLCSDGKMGQGVNGV